jgi:GNAT superfamily N-acetyltransferase
MLYGARGRDGIGGGTLQASASSVPLTDLPEAMRKKLPRYPAVPVARVGRLAVDERFKGMKLGAALLWDAIERAARSEVTVYAVVVDAKDEAVEGFYLSKRLSIYRQTAIEISPIQFVDL